MTDRSEGQRRIEAGYDRNYAYVRKMLADRTPPRRDWRDAVHDAVTDIDRIVTRDAHPDDVLHARTAISDLVAVWASPDEAEQIWLGEEAAR